MIVYGHRTTKLGEYPILDQCPNCQAQNKINIHVFQRYAHIFWLPFFPMTKKTIAQCDACQQHWETKDMPMVLKTAADNAKANFKTPIWTFSLLAILVVSIFWGINTSKKHEAQKIKYLNAPLVGDKVLFEENKMYHYNKIVAVAADSVYMLVGNMEINKLTKTYKLLDKEATAFSQDTEIYTKLELLQALKDGSIRDIERH
jgi:zinc-ribbon family